MIKIGLTGGIGTGKTYLSSYFEKMGIPVFHSDDEVKKLYKNEDVLKDMREEFPKEELWNDDGSLNMKELSNAFNDKEFLKRLTLFIHPYVSTCFSTWAQKQGTSSVIMESAIIFEYGFEKNFDMIIVADAPLELRIKRILLRNPNLTRDDVLKRMSCQISQEEKCFRADLVMCTGETYEESLKLR